MVLWFLAVRSRAADGYTCRPVPMPVDKPRQTQRPPAPIHRRTVERQPKLSVPPTVNIPLSSHYAPDYLFLL